MALRNGHGAGAGVPRIEVPPPDELLPPVPAPLPRESGPVRRRQDGKLADAASARELGRRGGLARARRSRMADALGLATVVEDTAFAPYRRAADEFHRHHLQALAQQAGGVCGDAPASMVASAALQLAASRFLFDQGAVSGDSATLKTASQLANDSRQNLLAAYELAVREAKARAEAAPTGHAALFDALSTTGGTQ